MNRTPGLMYAAQRGARWALPWLGAMAFSASVAYAITVGASGWSAASPPAIDSVSGNEVCDATNVLMLYVGTNSWIPADHVVVPCPESVP